jgi:acetyltransferase-like isoleucine patch superfamily enzyme
MTWRQLLRSLLHAPMTLILIGVRSVICTVGLRLRGVRCTFVTCEGRLPKIHSAGAVSLGRLALRGTLLPVELGATRGGRLAVGDRTFINQGASVVASLDIDIGSDVRIGDFVAVYDTDHHPLDQDTPTRATAVRIEDNVWLGRGAVVLPGVVIGRHAVVAAGSVVTSDVSAETMVAGNPARFVRALHADPGWRRE